MQYCFPGRPTGALEPVLPFAAGALITLCLSLMSICKKIGGNSMAVSWKKAAMWLEASCFSDEGWCFDLDPEGYEFFKDHQIYHGGML